MDELAHWIISVGTGALIGLTIVSVGWLLFRIAEALPNDFRVPFLTSLWEKMMTAIHKALRH